MEEADGKGLRCDEVDRGGDGCEIVQHYQGDSGIDCDSHVSRVALPGCRGGVGNLKSIPNPGICGHLQQGPADWDEWQFSIGHGRLHRYI